MLVARHILYLQQTCHQHCPLLTEIGMAIEVCVAPDRWRLPRNIIVLEPMANTIRLRDLKARLKESAFPAVLSRPLT